MNTMTAPAPVPTVSTPAENARHALIDVVLSDVENVARDTNVYTFRRPDGGKLPAYKPGAHIDIHLPNGLIRQFSLLNPSADPAATTVVYMPAKTLPALVAQACAAGLDPATPAVAVANATRAEERTIAGRVADIPALLAAEVPSGPVIVMIGSVFAGHAQEPARETARVESLHDTPRFNASG